MSTNVITPTRAMFPLADPTVEPGAPAEDTPFALTLARPSLNPPVDLTPYRYDPQRQVLVAGEELLPVADTVRAMNTPQRTVYDHQSFPDDVQDTYRD